MSDVLYTGAFAMLTPLGMALPMVDCALQAGVTAYRTDRWCNRNGRKMIVARIPDAALSANAEKLLALSAADEHRYRLQCLALSGLELLLKQKSFVGPVPLILVMPDARDWSQDVAFIAEVMEVAGLQADRANSYLLSLGRAGFAQALEIAGDLLRDSGVEAVIVGGVDSYLNDQMLEALDRDDRVLAQGVRDGFAPAEGVGFCVVSLTPPDVAPSVCVSGLGFSEESGHCGSDLPSTATGLSTALGAAMSESDRCVDSLYASLNGERYYAHEWAQVCIRNQPALGNAHAVQHPAELMGDVGAAAGIILCALAANRLQAHPSLCDALLVLASEKANRSVLYLHKPTGSVRETRE